MSPEYELEKLAKALQTLEGVREACDAFEARFQSYLGKSDGEHIPFLEAAIERFASQPLRFALSKVDNVEIGSWAEICADFLEAETFFKKCKSEPAGLIHFQLNNRDTDDQLLVQRHIYVQGRLPQQYEQYGKHGPSGKRYWSADRLTNKGVALRGLEEVMRIQRSQAPVIEQAQSITHVSQRLAGCIILAEYRRAVERAITDIGLPISCDIIIDIHKTSNAIEHQVFDYGPGFSYRLKAVATDKSKGLAERAFAQRLPILLRRDEYELARLITLLEELHYFCRATRRSRTSEFTESSLQICISQLLLQTGHTFDSVKSMSEKQFQYVLRDIATHKLNHYDQKVDLDKVMTPLVGSHREGLAEAVMDSILQERSPWFRMNWDKWLTKRNKRGARVWRE